MEKYIQLLIIKYNTLSSYLKRKSKRIISIIIILFPIMILLYMSAIYLTSIPTVHNKVTEIKTYISSISDRYEDDLEGHRENEDEGNNDMEGASFNPTNAIIQGGLFFIGSIIIAIIIPKRKTTVVENLLIHKRKEK